MCAVYILYLLLIKFGPAIAHSVTYVRSGPINSKTPLFVEEMQLVDPAVGLRANIV